MLSALLLQTSLLQKLWDKGVDIAAGVITSIFASLVVAAAGYLFWKKKLQMDREKERLIREDARRERDAEDAKTLNRRLLECAAERERLIAAVISAENETDIFHQLHALKRLVDSVNGFLSRNKELLFSDNSELYRDWRTLPSAQPAELRKFIEGINIPEPNAN